MVKKFSLVWSKGFAKRYYVTGTGIEVQIGKYRDLDKFDKYLKTKPSWHGKWYVDVLNHRGGSPKLFSSESQAKIYLKKVLNNIYRTKQLNKKKRILK